MMMVASTVRCNRGRWLAGLALAAWAAAASAMGQQVKTPPIAADGNAGQSGQSGQAIPEGRAATDKAWIKPDATLIVVLELARFWDGPERDRLQELARLHPFVSVAWLRDAEQATGLTARDVTRLVFSSKPPGGAAIAVEMTNPAHAGTLKTALLPTAETANSNGLTYFSNDRLALYEYQPTTSLIVLPAADMPPELLAIQNAAGQVRPLPKIEGAQPALLDVLVHVKAFRNGLTAANFPPAMASLLDAEEMRLSTEPSDKLTVRMTIHFPDEAKAEEGVSALHNALAHLDQYFAMSEQEMPVAIQRWSVETPTAAKLAPLMAQSLKAARAGLAQPSVTRTGNSVTGVVTIESEQPVTDAALLLSLVPRPAA